MIAYGTLFLWSFLAATVLPLGSEPVLVAVVVSGYAFWPAVAIATVGNVLGSWTTFWLARRGAAVLEHRTGAPVVDSRAGRLLQRYGQPALLLAWVPIVGDALVAVAGAVATPLLPFTVWVTIGKAARYVVVAWGAAALS